MMDQLVSFQIILIRKNKKFTQYKFEKKLKICTVLISKLNKNKIKNNYMGNEDYWMPTSKRLE